MNQLREEVALADELKKKKEVNEAAYGYGGKFGVQEDRLVNMKSCYVHGTNSAILMKEKIRECNGKPPCKVLFKPKSIVVPM